MGKAAAIISIVGAATLGAARPCPSSILVTRTVLVASRTNGGTAAIGMGTSINLVVDTRQP